MINEKTIWSVVGMLFPACLMAAPWAMPGDVVLRNQAQILTDEGIISGMTSTWPMNMGDLFYSLQTSDYDQSEYNFVADSLMTRLRSESQTGFEGFKTYVYGGSESQPVRTFYSDHRGQFGTGSEATVMGRYYVCNIKGNYTSLSGDKRYLSLDGSYAGVNLGNWTVAVDQVQRWWGPGLDGSLILSNNARSFPAFSITRNISKPIDFPVLEWLGHWNFTTFMGQAVDDRLQTPAHPFLFGMRAELQPCSAVDIGFSRMAQWGGHGRDQSWSSFGDMLIGKDNNGGNLSVSKEPGNQLAGMDFRVKPISDVPVAVYGQAIGEDLGGMTPTKLMYLGGVETWGKDFMVENSTWRLHLEYADTSARYALTHSPYKDYGYAYNHHIYLDGYRYDGLCLGDSIDGDGTSLSLGGLLCESNNRYWGLLLRHMNIDRYNASQYDEVQSVCRSHAYVDSVETYGGFNICENLAFQWAVAYMDRNHAKIIGVNSDVQFSVSLTYTY